MPHATLYVLVDIDVPEEILPRIQEDFQSETIAMLRDLIIPDDDGCTLVHASVHLDCPSIPFDPPLRLEVNSGDLA